MSSSAVIIANPVARSASPRKIEKAAGIIRAGGCGAEVLYTSKKGDAEDMARGHAGGNMRFVMAAGGDGTCTEVMNGLIGSETPMAILPIGTVNVLAREIGIPLDVKGAAMAALNGTPKRVSAGKITSGGQSRHFCLMAGIGFDAKAVSGVNLKLKRHSGKGAYIYNGFKTLFGWSPDGLEIEVDGATYRGYSLVVCNTSRYAGEFRIAADADIASPHLNVFIMHGRGRLDMLRYILGIMTGLHLKLRDITYLKADNIKVKGISDIQIDGDYLGKTPAMISIVPDAFRLICAV